MRNKIVNLVKENLLDIMPELEGEEISLDETFTNLGANSIDRVELITLTLERLQSTASRVEFAGAKTINELVDLLLARHEGHVQNL